MRIALRGDARADVEELAHPGLARQVADHPSQEGAVRPGQVNKGREGGNRLLGGLAVGGEVVLSSQPVVIHPGLVRNAGVKGRMLAQRAGTVVRPGCWCFAFAGHRGCLRGC